MMQTKNARLVALLEWIVILATFLWFLGVSLTVRRAPGRTARRAGTVGGG